MVWKGNTEDSVTDLAPDFDRSCRACGTKLEEMPVIHYFDATFPMPLHILQCSGCKGRLFVFDAPVKPLVLRSDEIRHQYSFTDFLEKRMEGHNRKHSNP